MKIAIIGAGLSGLTAGHELSKKYEVHLFERESQVGGMARSIYWDGYTFDYGVHVLHMLDEYAINLINTLLSSDIFKREYKARTYINGSFFDYPPSLKKISNFSTTDKIDIILSFINARLMSLFHTNEEDSFEDWLRLKIGRKFYEIFFKEYTKKWWGLPPNKISADLIKAAYISLFRYEKIIKFYPKNNGIGILSQKLFEKIQNNDGRFFFNHKLVDLTPNGNKISSLTFLYNNNIINREYDIVISTIPITKLCNSLKINTPRLSYRSLIFVFLIIDKPEILDTDWIHFPSPEFGISRVHEPKRLSQSCAPKDNSSLVIEIPCTKGDKVWRTDDATVANNAISELEEIGILAKDKIIDWKVSRLAYSHPIYTLDYKTNFIKVKKSLERYTNLYIAGRLGEYKYMTMDLAIRSGFDVSKQILKISRREK